MLQHLLRQPARGLQVGPHDVEVPEPEKRRHQLRRVAGLDAENAGAVEGAAGLGRRKAPAHLVGAAERDLQTDLLTPPGGRQGGVELEGAAEQLLGLAVGAARQRRAGGTLQVVDRPRGRLRIAIGSELLPDALPDLRLGRDGDEVKERLDRLRVVDFAANVNADDLEAVAGGQLLQNFRPSDVQMLGPNFETVVAGGRDIGQHVR